VKIGKGNYFRPIIDIHNLHEVSNDNGSRLITLATERDLIRMKALRLNTEISIKVRGGPLTNYMSIK